ncbi:MAG: uroporphyrinogen-III decarboxylase-like protein [Planctomycetes bacterium]|nr:uroporphyrinogen-III decarboxylase-like protein [Planctomycetota bacterium]
MTMTSRERWLAVLDGRKPDRVPMDYWATGEVTQRLLRDLNCADMDALYARLHIDAPEAIGAPRTVQGHPSDGQANLWGVRTREVRYEGGSYHETAAHPLGAMTTVEQIHAWPWPSADDHDYGAFAAQVKRLSGRRPVRCGGYEPFLLYCQMRGMEQAMMDLILEPAIAEAILGHLSEYHYALNGRMWEIADGKVDLMYLAEDLGSQTGLLMGLEQIRRFILPNQKRMADLARQHGIHIFYHTDGAARDVVADLITVSGIEILNPIQWRCPGMEREGLVRDFAGRVAFHGAVDNQYTLPFGSVEEVRAEVLDNLRIFPPHRYILAPCHNIQPVSPTENIVAMYETGWEHGRL